MSYQQSSIFWISSHCPSYPKYVVVTILWSKLWRAVREQTDGRTDRKVNTEGPKTRLIDSSYSYIGIPIIERRNKITLLAEVWKQVLMPIGDREPIAFPLEVVELDSLHASHMERLINCLLRKGFTNKLLQWNFHITLSTNLRYEKKEENQQWMKKKRKKIIITQIFEY